jgi:hypothetical protein
VLGRGGPLPPALGQAQPAARPGAVPQDQVRDKNNTSTSTSI